MPTPIIPNIEVGPVSRPSNEAKDLFDAAATGSASVLVAPEEDEWQAIYSLDLPSLTGEAINLRKLIDLANHVGLPGSVVVAIRSEAEANINAYISALAGIRSEILRLRGCSAPKFHVDTLVTHIATGNTYRITGCPDVLFIERGAIPAYAYIGTDNRVWVRPRSEMEDGRFVLCEEGE